MNRKLVAIALLTSAGLVIVADGCTGEYWTGGLEGCCPTDPKDPMYDDDICIEGRNQLAAARDAGYDGAGCRPNYPGFEGQAMDEAIETVCVPNAPDWFHRPQPLWLGPKGQDPGCSPDIGAFGDQNYDDLIIPDPGCPVCVCGPIEGSCSPRPNNILVRAGFCNVPETHSTDFAAPENWDGFCTSVNAIPAAAECPVGSGIPCAQSIYTSALLEPMEGCKPVPVPVPKLHSDLPSWRKTVLSCNATPLDKPCDDNDSTRFAALPEGWRRCVRHELKGVHECSSGSQYTDRIIAYPRTSYKDTRQCTECGCKASGGACYGTLNVYEDEQCTKFIENDILNSETSACSNLMPGQAIGSKELVDLTYLPGKCEPTGGLAIGTVEKNDVDAVTWCCLAGASEE